MAIKLIVVFRLLSVTSVIFAYRINSVASSISNSYKGNSTMNTLRQVNLVNVICIILQIIRHGQRSPQSTYPNDPYKNDPMAPFGWGQLTIDGRLSQYNQGLFLKKRYGNFLGTTYNPEIFWLQTTGADRAKVSALLEAAALWQLNSNEKFLPKLTYQPTYLNYQTTDKDDLLLIWSTCPDFARMREGLLKSAEIRNINEINKNLYKALAKHSGKNIVNPDDVFDLYSTLEAEQSMNYQLPNWTKEYFPELMKPLSILSLKMNVYNESLLKMKAAPLITKITDNMLKKTLGTLKPENRKMFMYIGHDSTITNLLEGLKVWDMQIPSYNTMSIMELHEEELGYNIQLYLRNTTEHEPYLLTIPGCNFSCPISQFLNLLSSMIITKDEWKHECTLKDPNYIPGVEPLP